MFLASSGKYFIQNQEHIRINTEGFETPINRKKGEN